MRTRVPVGYRKAWARGTRLRLTRSTEFLSCAPWGICGPAAGGKATPLLPPVAGWTCSGKDALSSRRR